MLRLFQRPIAWGRTCPQLTAMASRWCRSLPEVAKQHTLCPRRAPQKTAVAEHFPKLLFLL